MVGVLYVHLWNNHSLAENLRVSLFFVVSGFLITHILDRARASGQSVHILNFYIRRALRLFPALLVLVLVAFVCNAEGIRENFGWHMLQLSNVYFALTESFTPWVTAHLWSLNVLEQFYIVAPIVVLLLPRTGTYISFMILIMASLFIRANWSHLGIPAWWPNLVLSFDPVACGALAYLFSQNTEVARVLRSGVALVFSIAVLASPWYLWEGFGASETYRVIILPALCCIVVGTYHGYGGPVGFLLASRPARFLSKISYGVYIYHLMVWWLVVQVAPDLYQRDFRTFLVISVITVLIAIISWHFVERPIEKLKKHFPTTGRE